MSYYVIINVSPDICDGSASTGVIVTLKTFKTCAILNATVIYKNNHYLFVMSNCEFTTFPLVS